MSKVFGKGDLVESIAGKTGVAKSTVQAVIEGLTSEINIQTLIGQTVNLPGFGRFSMKQRAARTGRNPRTGESVEIAASSTLTFKASKAKGA